MTSLPDAWPGRISARTGQPGVSMLWLVEIASLICSFCRSLEMMIPEGKRWVLPFCHLVSYAIDTVLVQCQRRWEQGRWQTAVYPGPPRGPPMFLPHTDLSLICRVQHLLACRVPQGTPHRWVRAGLGFVDFCNWWFWNSMKPKAYVTYSTSNTKTKTWHFMTITKLTVDQEQLFRAVSTAILLLL